MSLEQETASDAVISDFRIGFSADFCDDHGQ